MPCRDYEHRPQVCRDYSCGKPCEHCGSCCCDLLLAIPDGTVLSDPVFLELHGVTQRQDGLYIRAKCRNWSG